jgi:hypothetical protein
LGPVEHISSDVVRKNVEILKIILNRVSQLYEDPSSKDTSTKSILVFMHRIRGEIRFFDPYSDTIDPREWTCLRFCFSASPKSQESFSLDVSNIEEKCFSWEDLKPEAFTTLKETIKTVRFLSRLYPKLPNLSTTLKKFSLTDVDSLFNRFAGKDIIHEAWYSLDKKEDSFAEILEEQLSLSHKETIACITLSFTSDMKQICDKTLVKNKKGWTVYNDDPNLETQFYPSIYSLLDSLKNIINTPLILLKK